MAFTRRTLLNAAGAFASLIALAATSFAATPKAETTAPEASAATGCGVGGDYDYLRV